MFRLDPVLEVAGVGAPVRGAGSEGGHRHVGREDRQGRRLRQPAHTGSHTGEGWWREEGLLINAALGHNVNTLS